MDPLRAKALQVEAARRTADSVTELAVRIARLEEGQAQILEYLRALLAARPTAAQKKS